MSISSSSSPIRFHGRVGLESVSPISCRSKDTWHHTSSCLYFITLLWGTASKSALGTFLEDHPFSFLPLSLPASKTRRKSGGGGLRESSREREKLNETDVPGYNNKKAITKKSV